MILTLTRFVHENLDYTYIVQFTESIQHNISAKNHYQNDIKKNTLALLSPKEHYFTALSWILTVPECGIARGLLYYHTTPLFHTWIIVHPLAMLFFLLFPSSPRLSRHVQSFSPHRTAITMLNIVTCKQQKKHNNSMSCPCSEFCFPHPAWSASKNQRVGNQRCVASSHFHQLTSLKETKHSQPN